MLKHYLIALFLLLAGLAGLALSCDTPRRTAYGTGYGGYRAPAYRAPAYKAPAYYTPFKVLIADVYYSPVYDPLSRDLFIFHGPPGAPATAGPIGGLPPAQSAGGQGTHPTAPPLFANGSSRVGPAAKAGAIIRDDEARAAVEAPVAGYEAGRGPARAAQPAPPPGADLSFLRAACAECHSPEGGKKVKGGFTLFAPDGSVLGAADWRAVHTAVTSHDGKSPPAMPPGGRAPLSAAQVAVIRGLIR